MSEWWDGPLYGFDLETTGTDPNDARVVTASLVLTRGDGSIIDAFDWLVNPGVEIPAGAIAVHGITNEQASAEGAPAAAAVDDIISRLHQALLVAPVVVMNAQYDMTVLDREARRHGYPSFDDPRPIVDPFVLDKQFSRFRKGSRKLEALCSLYGVELLEAHTACADAVAAVGVVRKIGRLAPFPPPDVLHENQVVWKREQQTSLEDYFRRTGVLDSPVAKEWPVIPVGVGE